ncbi:MAG: DUF2249 domain-containing protein, partial [Kofleriaceae bacterium]|nr:DUF2249 domain-containing protein [Kofleriaceae bacterium]
MNKRSKSKDRQAEIIGVTLALLENTPLASLTTRQIANQLSISQPALFRHFRSREQLLLALMHQARTDLSAIADSVLAQVDTPLDRLRVLARRLLEHVETYPGLARLLFSPPQPGLLRDELKQMVGMQRSLITQLIKDGQAAQVFRNDLNPTDAAMYYVGMIQGIVLRYQLEDPSRTLAAHADSMFSMWLNGITPESTNNTNSAPQEPAPVSDNPAARVHLRALDVRPILARGGDPLDTILSTLATLHSGGVLTVLVSFRPAPLLRLLEERGHWTLTREIKNKLWCVDIVVDGVSPIVELLDLEPPEPLERVLEALSRLTTSETYIVRLP